MPARVRPLSPYLVYRWQIGNTLSILHRATGIALAFGLVALTYWLVALATGDGAYDSAMRVFGSAWAFIFLLGWIFSFFYHLLNGVRHLFWDAGYGFERAQRRASGWVAVGGATACTVCICWVIWRGTHP